jgi:hypothetical protein
VTLSICYAALERLVEARSLREISMGPSSYAPRYTLVSGEKEAPNRLLVA